MPFHERDRAGLKRLRTKEAINLAMQSRWEEAVSVNRNIIENFPTDSSAYNRLGRALIELGAYEQAREAYGQALELDPYNTIAQKNLKRLALLTDDSPGKRSDRPRIVPQLFTEDIGNVGIVTLCHLASAKVLAKLASGNEVYLKPKGQNLIVENSEGEYLGQINPKHELRLLSLIEGGNKYEAAIASVAEDEVTVIIKETYRHPSQEGRLSFPRKDADGFRPYVREGLFKREVAEDELGEEGVEGDNEIESGLLPNGFSLIGGVSFVGEKDDLSEEE